jgi:anthranilate synthase component 1
LHHITSNNIFLYFFNSSLVFIFTKTRNKIKATFPAGTLSGAPKVRAMEIINEVEPVKRNIYSGAIGHLSWHGCMDMAIAIRTAVIKNETLYVQAGAGIVYDSDPQSEWNETLHKANAIIKAVEKV